jgi:calcineurin-like phosphoesterase family protein
MIYIISDTHFGHKNILTFKREDGSPLRTFDDIDHMDNTMIDNWNNTVQDNDTIYHLGDVVMNKKYLNIISRLNGRKILILGNHDVFDYSDYSTYFDKVYGSIKIKGLFLTHIPIHIDSIPSGAYGNIHGHIHDKIIDHPRYYNACVEHSDYTPIPLDKIIETFTSRKIKEEKTSA